MQHYRCYKVYIKTKREKVIPLLETSSTDRAIVVIKELTHVIKTPTSAPPFNNHENKTTEALNHLENIYLNTIVPDLYSCTMIEKKK